MTLTNIIDELDQLRLITLIMPYFDIDTFKSLRLVNIQCNQIANREYNVHLRIKLNMHNFLDEIDALESMSGLRYWIKSATLEGHCLNSSIFASVATQLLAMTELSLNNIKLNEPMNLSPLTQLQVLRLKNISLLYPSESKHFHVPPQLCKLYLHYSNHYGASTNFILPNFKHCNLESLVIRMDQFVIPHESNYFEFNARSDGSLRYLHLDIHGCADQLRYIQANIGDVRGLRVLKLKSAINGNRILNELTECDKLEEFHLNIQQHLNYDQLYEILDRSQATLSHLNFNDAIQLEERFNELLFLNLVHLRSLAAYLAHAPTPRQWTLGLMQIRELTLANTSLPNHQLSCSRSLVKLECRDVELADLTQFEKLIWFKCSLMNWGPVPDAARFANWMWLHADRSTNGGVIGIRMTT